jgi:hypothetical protein
MVILWNEVWWIKVARDLDATLEPAEGLLSIARVVGLSSLLGSTLGTLDQHSDQRDADTNGSEDGQHDPNILEAMCILAGFVLLEKTIPRNMADERSGCHFMTILVWVPLGF